VNRAKFLRTALLTVLICLLHETAFAAKVFVINWFTETQGTISSPNEFDSYLEITYLGGLDGVPDGGGATVSLYLLDNAGVPLKSASNADVCNPCVFGVSNGANQEVAPFDNLIQLAGGFPSPALSGFGIVTVDGDSDQVALQSFITNSHESAFRASTLGFIPDEISGSPSDGRFLSFIGAPESNGTTSSSEEFDTVILASYAGGIAGLPAGSGATVHLYMYDRDTGLPAQGVSGDVCNPCSIPLGPGTPHDSFRLQDAFILAGGFLTSFESVDVLARITGDAHLVSMMGVIANSYSGPFEIALTNLGTMEHPFPERPTSVENHAVPRPPGLRSAPNPFNPSVEIEYVISEAGPVRIDIFDARGALVTTLHEAWLEPGTRVTRWNGTNQEGKELSSGVYFARLTSASGTRTLKMTLLR
jgi:hypothetical protein